MKILLILFFTLSAWAFKEGGVDVGNGHQKNTRGTFVLAHFQSEYELAEHLKASLEDMRNGTIPEVSELVQKGNCAPGAEFSEMEAETVYVLNKQGKLVRKSSGIVAVTLKDCFSPGNLTKK